MIKEEVEWGWDLGGIFHTYQMPIHEQPTSTFFHRNRCYETVLLNFDKNPIQSNPTPNESVPPFWQNT